MDFALQVLETIILTSIVILAVWLINRAIGSKAGYRWRKILWLVLAVRLIFPMSLNLTEYFSSFQQLEMNIPLPDSASHAAISSDMLIPSEGTNTQTGTVLPDADDTLNGTVQTGNTVNNTVNNKHTDLSQNTLINPTTDSVVNTASVMSENTILTSALIIWAVGVLVSIGIRVFQYHWLKSKYLKKALLCEDASLIAMMNSICNEFGIKKPLRIMVQDNITSPMLFGYFSTILFLPEIPYSEAELNSVLRHELTHYKHKDLWYKLLMMFTCDLYWFNPVFRLMKRMAYKDVECICDEKATKHMSLEDKRTYCNSILKTMTGVRDKNLAFTTQFAANKKTAKQRLENILASPNRKAGVAILVVLLVAMIMGTACVSFNISSENETDDTAEEMLEADETEDATEEEIIATVSDGNTLTIDTNVLANTDEAILKELKALYPDFEITTTKFTADNYDALYSADAESTTNTPTIFSSNGIDVVEFGKAGKIADITDILAKRGWLDQMNPNVRSMVSDENGRVYGIPTNPSYALGIMYNVELFEAAGLIDEEGLPIMPQTWQELAETAVKIKEATGQAGFCLLAGDNAAAWHFTNIALNFGAPEFCIANDDGTYTANIASDQIIEAMKFVKDLKWEYDVLTEDPTKEDYTTGHAHIGNGSAAMYISANDAIHLPAEYGLASDKLALGAMPAGPSGVQYSQYSDPCAYAFSADATAEEIDAALSLIEMLGFGPVLNDANKARIESNIILNTATIAPRTGEISMWNNTEIAEFEQSVLAEHGNTNQALYESYFAAINTPGNLKLDRIYFIAGAYYELTAVLKEVVSNPDADVEALMKQANENYQKNYIDNSYN